MRGNKSWRLPLKTGIGVNPPSPISQENGANFWSHNKTNIVESNRTKKYQFPEKTPVSELITKQTTHTESVGFPICQWLPYLISIACKYASLMWILTWTTFHSHHREGRLLQDGLLQCDLLLWCPRLPFNILCKYQLSFFHLKWGFDFF